MYDYAQTAKLDLTFSLYSANKAYSYLSSVTVITTNKIIILKLIRNTYYLP